MTGIILCLFLLVPNFVGATRTASQLPYMPSDAWMAGLHWLKTNTPQVDEKKPEYSVLSWWDYGYWIVREAKRPVVICPGGGDIIAMARFLLAKEGDTIEAPIFRMGDIEPMSLDAIRERYGIKYIIIDYQMMTGKFYAIPECAGYTPANPAETMIGKLWDTGKFGKWEKVWESNQKYLKHSQLKIYEYKGAVNLGN
jgi:dolichyl-diphosphooligosaccharide--protein glycosyltransferase